MINSGFGQRVRTGGIIFVLLLVFYLIHADLLIFGNVRLAHDIFAGYSNFYFAINCLLNGSLPLWDPYTHAGQPYMYQFVKIPTGEFTTYIFGLIAFIFKSSILQLYGLFYAFHFLIFAFGCYYLASTIFKRRSIALYVLLVSLFASNYGNLMESEAPILTEMFLPWAMAFFILFVKGKARSYHLFAAVLTCILYVQTTEFLSSAYFLVIFFICYSLMHRKELSFSAIKRSYWLGGGVLLLLGLVKSVVVYADIHNIVPSLRYFTGAESATGVDITSPSSQTSPANHFDYMNLLNPVVDLDPVAKGGEYQLYIGIIPVFLAFYSLFVNRKSRLLWSLLVPTVISIVVSFGPTAVLSRIFFYVLPLFKTIRVMQQFALAPVYVGVVFMSALGLESLLRRVEEYEDMELLWKHVRKYIGIFTLAGIAVSVYYVFTEKPDDPSLKRELYFMAFSYYLILLSSILIIATVQALKTNSGAMKKARIILVPFSLLLAGTGIMIILWELGFEVPHVLAGLIVVLKRLFFGSYYAIIQQFAGGGLIIAFILITAGVLLTSGLFFVRGRSRSSLIVITCLLLTLIDLLRTSGLHPITQYELKTFDVPEYSRSFPFQPYRKWSFWPEDVDPVYFKPPVHPLKRYIDTIVVRFRPAMLYLESSVITIPMEYDYYMLRYSWDVFKNMPEAARNIAMGITAPKIGFFQQYSESNDNDVFSEIERNGADILTKLVYLAPDGTNLNLDMAPGGADAPFSGEVTHFGNNSLSLSINTPVNGLLYYSDGYDNKWKCFIDGKEQPVRRANISSKAVFVSGGQHTVRFLYRPVAYLVSLSLFFVSCGICIVLVPFLYFNTKKAGGDKSSVAGQGTC